jgi:hypothetical protein
MIKLKTSPETKEFSTRDIYLSAALKLHGLQLIKITVDNNNKGIFVFSDSPDREKLVNDYFNGSLVGSHKHYVTSWKDIKGLLFETIRK